MWRVIIACGLAWLLGANAGAVLMGSILQRPLFGPIMMTIGLHVMIPIVIVRVLSLRTRQ